MDNKIISRSEEFILLAVLRLKANAYGVTIRDCLRKTTGKSWAYGALFVMLRRLEDKGYLESHFAEPTAQRGGKSKRYFRLSAEGLRVLRVARRVQESAWSGIGEPAVPGTRASR